MFSSRIIQKTNFLSSLNRSRTYAHDLPEYRSSAPTTELWRSIYLSIAVCHGTCVTHKNLVYNLARHESSITQWLENPTGIPGSTSVVEVRKFIFWVIRLENASSFKNKLIKRTEQGSRSQLVLLTMYTYYHQKGSLYTWYSNHYFHWNTLEWSVSRWR